MRSLALFLCVIGLTATVRGETVEVFDGAIKLETPKNWKSMPPQSRIVEKEYSISKDGEEGSARLTMMAAGGDIDANIKRWVAQFTKTDGEAKIEKMDVGSNEIHFVDLKGTFKESMGGGPFFGGKTVIRENYRMLGAIVVNEGRKYFIKMTGPNAIVDANRESFKSMLKEIK